jgi:hypothetical protein
MKLKEHSGIEGIITFQNYSIDTLRAQQIDEYLASRPQISPEKYREYMRELRQLCRRRILTVNNQVILAARAELAKRLVGTYAYTGVINYGALGSGSTAISDADTVLDTEVARALVATATQTNDTAAIDFYFSKASTNGTYAEFGMFIDGTGSADSGLLFNRALTGGWTKSSSEAMTVSIQINFNVA